MPKYNKEGFDFRPEEFIKMREVDRIEKIHVHPTKFKRELENRKKILDTTLKYYFDGMSRSGMEEVKTSYRGTHADVTAEVAINESEFLRLSSDEATEEDLLKMDIKKMPPELKGYLILKRSLYLYERVLDLFPEDVTIVLNYRMNGKSKENIAEILDRSTTYVGDRITKSYNELSEKANEAIGMYFFGRIDELESR